MSNVLPIPSERLLAQMTRVSFGCDPEHGLPVPAEQIVALHQLTVGVRNLLALSDLPEPEDDNGREVAQMEMDEAASHLRHWLGLFDETMQRQMGTSTKPKLWRPS